MTLDMRQFTEPKSDRLVADDFLSGPKTYVVSGVKGAIIEGEKRTVIALEGAERPFIPCKGMVRLLSYFWGIDDGEKWVGNSLTLYRDPDVQFPKQPPGGVRICAVSGITEAKKVPIRTSQRTVKGYEVSPIADTPLADPARKFADAYIAKVNAADTAEALNEYVNSRAVRLAELEGKNKALHAECIQALTMRRDALAFGDDDFNDDEQG